MYNNVFATGFNEAALHRARHRQREAAGCTERSIAAIIVFGRFLVLRPTDSRSFPRTDIFNLSLDVQARSGRVPEE